MECYYTQFTAADMTYGTIFCFECGDYVYDKELESIAQIQNEKAAKSLGLTIVCTIIKHNFIRHYHHKLRFKLKYFMKTVRKLKFLLTSV